MLEVCQNLSSRSSHARLQTVISWAESEVARIDASNEDADMKIREYRTVLRQIVQARSNHLRPTDGSLPFVEVAAKAEKVFECRDAEPNAAERMQLDQYLKRIDLLIYELSLKSEIPLNAAAADGSYTDAIRALARNSMLGQPAARDASVVLYVPSRMIVQEDFIVALEIAVPPSDDGLLETAAELRGRIVTSMPDTPEESIVADLTEAVRPLTSLVSAKLVSNKFEIEPLGPTRQKLEGISTGSWSWRVRPLEPGNHTLSVRIESLAESADQIEIVNSSPIHRKVRVRNAKDAFLTERSLRVAIDNDPVPAFSSQLPENCTLMSTEADGAGRYALLIGNQAYSRRPLSKPHSDVDQLAEVLAEENFNVIVCKDINRIAFEQALAYLTSRTRTSELPSSKKAALIYFSGHGLGASNAAQNGDADNFLLPVDFDLRDAEGATDEELADSAISLGWVSEALRAGSVGNVDTAMFIVDACRSTAENATAEKGLGRMNWRDGDGRIFFYATGYGKTTPDNGLFAATLADQIRRNGHALQGDYLLIETAKEIYSATGGWQNPQIEGQYRRRFWFDFEKWSASQAGK